METVRMTTRKKILELLIWLTCITTLVFIYSAVRNHYQEKEFEINRLEKVKAIVYDELSNNKEYIENSILEYWKSFYAHVYINKQYMTVKDFHGQVNRLPFLMNFQTYNWPNSGWEYLKYNSQAPFLDGYDFTRLSETYRAQDKIIESSQKLFKAYADLVPFIKDSETIDIYSPKFSEFKRHMHILNNLITNMPQIYDTAKYVLDSKKYSVENERKKDVVNYPYLFYKEQLEQYRIQLFSLPPARTTDSIKIKIREGIQVFANEYNKNIIKEYKKLSPEEYTYIVEKKENRILILTRIPDFDQITLEKRKQVITAIKNSLNTFDFKEGSDYYIGVFSRGDLVMAKTPKREETDGIYANPRILLSFYFE